MSLNNRQAFSFVRLPADSAGKRLTTTRYVELPFANATHDFKVGDYVEGETTTAEAEVVAVYYSTGNSGTLFVIPEDEGAAMPFQEGEGLIHMGTVVATVSALPTDLHVQNFNLVGKNNPIYGQAVDKDGAASIRFTEGAQQLDAYGLSRMVAPVVLCSYNFQYDEEPEDFAKIVSGGGSITHDSAATSVNLDVGTAQGDRAIFTSNVHYPTWPGSGQIITMAVASGDSGKDGCVRRFGYYNDSVGVFFELDGSTLYAVHRSLVNGVPTDTRTPQVDWNMDSISASDSTDGMVLDVTKLNVYWFNLQTLTGGRLKYGLVNEDGTRIGVHNSVDLNDTINPSIVRTSLPLRVEILNKATTGSPSRLKLYAATVKTEGPTPDDTQPISRYSGFGLPAPITLSGNGQNAILSLRASKLFKGNENRVITVPTSFCINVSGGPVIFRVIKNATLGDGNWMSMGSYTPVEGSTDKAYVSGGREFDNRIFGVGATKDRFDGGFWGFRGECLTLRGDGEYGDVFTLTAQRLDPTDASVIKVSIALTWSDLG